MSNLNQFLPDINLPDLTLTSSTTTEPTSDSDAVEIIDPSLAKSFFLRSGDQTARVYFKLLDGSYMGQKITLIRDRHLGWWTYNSGNPGAGGDSGLTIHSKVFETGSFVWSWTNGGGMNTSAVFTWHGNHWSRTGSGSFA
tara:strand:+ start:467 stop:886 length:420 start_codon:yes stop_codon:yes gene_type:complete